MAGRLAQEACGLLAARYDRDMQHVTFRFVVLSHVLHATRFDCAVLCCAASASLDGDRSV